ncbi:anti-sigma factor family protein [Allorhizobium taibaishanense]|uniref:Anti-sigma factor RsiW n=1 Tax=Allorhizobium taibaishanense TaxID=887144 RepID=A0A1Q9A0E4_9HYPH|nr:anti-sigma factor [Allorhizobium taibaishanense]MBB4010562.1 anti-sigma factor RsiW [Allorhizobium taibaishanense]OLP47903.1 hypothetical protein BJF91_10810 [Allorhizobium taibaishanense]
MTRKPITEDDLQAYVDKALSPERCGDVAEYLLTNPDASMRVAAYERQSLMLRASLDPVAREPIPSRLNLANIAANRAANTAPSFWRMAAAAAIILAIGATGGWTLKGLSIPATEGVAALAQEASASYGVFASDRIRPVEVRADGTDSLKQLASDTLGALTVLPDLSKSGYRLMGGRVVPTAHGPGLMLMYDNDKGSRLVMLTRRMQVDQDKPMVANSDASVRGWSWANNGMGFSLVGSLPAADLHSIADLAKAQVATSL